MTKVYHAHQLPLFPSRVCYRCGEEKLLIDQFSIRRDRKDGYETVCKECKQQKNKSYYRTHREEVLQQHKEYRDAHREQSRQNSREWHAAHREYARQQRLAYYALHQERLQQNSREYYHENKDQALQRRRAYYATNLEQIRRRSSDYQAAHPEQTRNNHRAWHRANPLKRAEYTRYRQARKKNTSVDRINYRRILERDGMYCYICEQAILPHHILHFDHMTPLARGGAHAEENIKPTHKQCNLRKGNRLLSEMTAHQRRGITG